MLKEYINEWGVIEENKITFNKCEEIELKEELGPRINKIVGVQEQETLNGTLWRKELQTHK